MHSLIVKEVLNPIFLPFSLELNEFDLGFRVLWLRKLKILKKFFPLAA